MLRAGLLTLAALAGVALGLSLGKPRLLSGYLAAAGGGLLFGISLFWLLPEIAAASGWLPAWILTLAAWGVLALLDHFFLHEERTVGRAAIRPLLVATAVHSFLDGWSVRALASQPLAGIAVPLGLALHKVPEGLAIGWVARRATSSPLKGAAMCVGVELMTLLGAYVEPGASRSGFAAFGPWWNSGVIAVIGGSFLFLGIHAVLPNRKRAGMMLIFLVTLIAVGALGLVKGAGV